MVNEGSERKCTVSVVIPSLHLPLPEQVRTKSSRTAMRLLTIEEGVQICRQDESR